MSKVNVQVLVTTDLRESCETVCRQEGVRLVEVLRFCMIYMRDTGRLPINVPEEYRRAAPVSGLATKAQSKTFFN